jgi:hypothetical protein
VLVMRGGPMERREVFETWRGPAGERWQRSLVTPADGSYFVEGEWRSDAAGLREAARGRRKCSRVRAGRTASSTSRRAPSRCSR